MTLQTLINAWTMSGRYQSTPPATEADLRDAEAKIGTPLSLSLREGLSVIQWADRSK